MQFHKHRPTIIYLLVLLFAGTILSLCLYTIASLYFEKKINDWCFQTDKQTYYLYLMEESLPPNHPNTAETLRNYSTLYDSLSTSENYTYYEQSTQPLKITEKDRFFDEITEKLPNTSDTASCVQISQNVQTDFKLSVSQGRLLNDEDFHLARNEQIPVLMGYNYASIYQLGDTFQANYLFSDFSFVIVGFLEKDCAIINSNGTIPLNCSIIMPSFMFDYAPMTSTEYVTQKIHDSNKVSGNVRIQPESYDAAYAEVTKKLSDASFAQFSWVTSNRANLPVLFGMTSRTAQTVCLFFSSILAILLFIILYSFLWKIDWKSSKTPIILLFLLCICNVILSYIICRFALSTRLELDVRFSPWISLIACAIYILYALILLHRKKRHS